MRREWPTDIGPVDLMCRDIEDEWVAVEIKRIATMEAVEQLTRYLERIRLDPALASCRGVLVAKWIKPQARVLAVSRGIDCVEVDIEVLRGEPRARADVVCGVTPHGDEQIVRVALGPHARGEAVRLLFAAQRPGALFWESEAGRCGDREVRRRPGLQWGLRRGDFCLKDFDHHTLRLADEADGP